MGAVAPVPRICGREAEIQALGAALGRVAAGEPAIVLVEGEAGIGKTRLLEQILQDARGRGMQVAAGRAEELERTGHSAYWPLLWGALGQRLTRGGRPSPGC
jgi:predicted ATPase